MGDILLLQRWEPDRGDYTCDESGWTVTLAKRITYVLPGGQFGVETGFVVLGLGDAP